MRAASSVPNSHFIEDVPWHEQMNALSCAAGALEIVFHYWGADIDQKEIMNVARTSSSGTWSPDLVQTGQFSVLSDAQGRFFPSIGPDRGFNEKKIGYASFSHSSDGCWLDDLKAIVANDIPVIVLMSYEPTGGGGHYRVVIGYDDAKQTIYLSDPWGRDTKHQTQETGMVAWSYSDFQKAWSYSEAGTAQPYCSAVIIPWSVDVTVKGKPISGSAITLTARISYQCPEPFDRSEFLAQEVMVRIALPEGMTLVSGSVDTSIGTLNAGGDASVTWKVLCSTNSTGKNVSISATGIISGSVPVASWQGQSMSYPAYSYFDIIGAEESVTL